MIVITEDKTSKDIGGRQFIEHAIILTGFDEKKDALIAAGIKDYEAIRVDNSPEIIFESRDGYDFMRIKTIDFKSAEKISIAIEVFITKNTLIILSEHVLLEWIHKEISSVKGASGTHGKILSILLAYMISINEDFLYSLENGIENLEEEVSGKKPEDKTVTFISLRKQILSLKRYYTALYELIEDLEENANNAFSSGEIQNFQIHRNRTGRLLNTMLSLQDYLTHVRETYQNQLSIGLNETMQFFTVITAIFLPLTLIVGWYGMNLRMPELEYAITYPIVCIISVSFVAVSLIYCKRNGWF